MILELEGLKFVLPSSTLLVGPMAAAKPLFALKFVASVLNRYGDYRAIIFATSSPKETILNNLKVFHLSDDAEKRITFFDFDPLSEELMKINDVCYVGNFSDPDQLKKALHYARENDIVVIPSFTLLLVGAKDRTELAEILAENLLKRQVTSLVAVNSAMFVEINKNLEGVADNVIAFTKRGKEIYFKPIKFKGEAPEREIRFEFPKELFEKTKKEVALRTSELIKEAKMKRQRTLN
jgi:KaiC/GvpD/RAD55 family RecA-like ATPase